MSQTGIEPLLNAIQIAKILNVSKSYVYKILDNRMLPSIKIGKSIRVKPEDLERFIVSTRQE